MVRYMLCLGLAVALLWTPPAHAQTGCASPAWVTITGVATSQSACEATAAVLSSTTYTASPNNGAMLSPFTCSCVPNPDGTCNATLVGTYDPANNIQSWYANACAVSQNGSYCPPGPAPAVCAIQLTYNCSRSVAATDQLPVVVHGYLGAHLHCIGSCACGNYPTALPEPNIVL